MKKMKNNKQKKNTKKRKQKFNMYVWGQKNKKVFASIICCILVLGMLVSLIQI